MRFSLAVVVVVAAALLVAQCSGKTCGSTGTDGWGHANTMPILDGNSNLKFVNQSANFKLYYLTIPGTGPTDEMNLPVVHVYGTPYEQGCGHGHALSGWINTFITEAWKYSVDNVQEAILPYVNKWAAHAIATKGLEAALDMEYEITVNYTSPDFYEEMHGVADCSGVDYDTLRRLHQIPGITKGACSMFGSWGDAVAESGHLIQLRALDWDMEGPWRNYNALIVYHPSDPKQGHRWLNVAFPGWVGALTGMSEKQMAISEIGVTYPDSTWGPPEGTVPIPGVPFIDLLRNILKVDNTIDDAISRMQNAKRAEDLILGVGDGKAGYFRGIQYGPYAFDVMDPSNQRPVASWHPQIDDTVYWGMDWECPSFNEALGTLLQNNFGEVSGPNTVTNIMGQLTSGSNHIAVYDLTSQEIWVSFCAPFNATGPLNAFDRQFVNFKADTLFNDFL
jgi:hypothetical protein